MGTNNNRLQQENNLSSSKIQNFENQVRFKDSEISMINAAKEQLERQILSMTDSMKMKDGMLSNAQKELNMVKNENNLFKNQCQSQQNEIQSLNDRVRQFQTENMTNQQQMKELRTENM